MKNLVGVLQIGELLRGNFNWRGILLLFLFVLMALIAVGFAGFVGYKPFQPRRKKDDL